MFLESILGVWICCWAHCIFHRLESAWPSKWFWNFLTSISSINIWSDFPSTSRRQISFLLTHLRKAHLDLSRNSSLENISRIDFCRLGFCIKRRWNTICKASPFWRGAKLRTILGIIQSTLLRIFCNWISRKFGRDKGILKSKINVVQRNEELRRRQKKRNWTYPFGWN